MNQREQTNEDEIVIDLREIWAVIRGRLLLIIASGIILALLTMIATKLFITPQYESTTKMYVLNKQDSSTLTSSDMQTSTLLTKDYAELIQNRNVTEAVIAQLNLGIQHEDLMKKLTVETPTDTRVISIIVRDEDPYMAAKIADTIRDVSATHIQEVMAIEAVNVAERANIPSEPVTPKTLRNGFIGGVLGLLICIAVVVISYLSNDTIQSAEDVERYLGLSFLGNIPLQNDERTTKKKHKNKSKSKNKHKKKSE